MAKVLQIDGRAGQKARKALDPEYKRQQDWKAFVRKNERRQRLMLEWVLAERARVRATS